MKIHKMETVDIGLISVISIELASLCEVLGINLKTSKNKTTSDYGSKYHFATIKKGNTTIRLGIGIIGNAGNIKSGIYTTNFIRDLNPSMVILIGIAAGLRGKIKIGDVAFSECIVPYDTKEKSVKDGISIERTRHRTKESSFYIEQEIASYLAMLRQNSGKHITSIFSGDNFKKVIPKRILVTEEEWIESVAKVPSVGSSVIASGESLLRDPNVLLLYRETLHGKIEIGEMEAAGFAEACNVAGVQWTVIRGISDFGDHLKSDEFHLFASIAAASITKDFIKNSLDLALIKKKTKDEYRFNASELKSEINNKIHPAAGKNRYELKLSLAADYNKLLDHEYAQTKLSVSKLLTDKQIRMALIQSPGGFGKTSYLSTFALSALNAGVHVYWLNINNLKKQNYLNFKEVFGNSTLCYSYEEFHKSLAGNNEVVLVIDGINEVYSDISDIIFTEAQNLYTSTKQLRVFIADRMTTYNHHQHILRATVEPISEAFINKYLSEKKINGQYVDKTLLKIPFFFDLISTLLNTKKNISSRVNIFISYFLSVVKLNKTSLEELSFFAFGAYKNSNGLRIDMEWASKNISQILLAKLEKAGIVIIATDFYGKHLKFRHQLFQDFLAANYLVIHPDKWSHANFDALTFKTKNIEALSFCMEILSANRKQELIERFIIKIYDWNYRSINNCLKILEQYNIPIKISYDLEFIFLVKDTEKKFELFEDTRVQATNRILESQSTLKSDFLAIQTFEQLLLAVKAYTPQSKLAKEWKEIFLWTSNRHLTDVTLLKLKGNPIVSWTLSNSIRRMKLSIKQQAILKQLFYSAKSNPTLRWKIIHSMGTYPSQKNLTFCIEAFLFDKNVWVRFGALRGIIEYAYLAKNLRPLVIEWLVKQIPKIDEETLFIELRRTLIIANANEDWYISIEPIFKKVLELTQIGSTEKNWWKTMYYKYYLGT
jgi:nucleoside phosphorylase